MPASKIWVVRSQGKRNNIVKLTWETLNPYRFTFKHIYSWKDLGRLTWFNCLLLGSESESGSVVSDSLRPHGVYNAWNSPGQNTGEGSLSLLQRLFPTQKLNPGLLLCRPILYHLSHQGSPRILEWIAYPYSRGSSRSRNRTGSPILQADSLPAELAGKPGPFLVTSKCMYFCKVRFWCKVVVCFLVNICLFVWCVGCLFGWLVVNWLFGWLVSWLVGWFFSCLVGYLVGWLIAYLLLVCWLFGWLFSWLVVWLVVWLFSCLFGCLDAWLIGWLFSCLVGCLVGWLIGCLVV